MTFLPFWFFACLCAVMVFVWTGSIWAGVATLSFFAPFILAVSFIGAGLKAIADALRRMTR